MRRREGACFSQEIALTEVTDDCLKYCLTSEQLNERSVGTRRLTYRLQCDLWRLPRRRSADLRRAAERSFTHRSSSYADETRCLYKSTGGFYSDEICNPGGQCYRLTGGDCTHLYCTYLNVVDLRQKCDCAIQLRNV